MIGPVHPGVTLREDFMEPYGLSAARLAEALGVSRNRIGDILRGGAASPPTRRFGWSMRSASRRRSGSICNLTTSWSWRAEEQGRRLTRP